MTNKGDFYRLAITLAVTCFLNLFLWPLFEICGHQVGRGRIHDSREVDLKFLKESAKVGKPNLFVWFCGEALAFPLFYTLVFAVLPGLIVIFSKKLLEDEVEEAFFFNSSVAQDLKVEQILLWLAVYCFCGTMFSVLLSCLQAIPTTYDSDTLFQRFPIQYSDKIFTQFGVIGSFLLLVAIVSAAIKIGPELAEDDLLNLLRAGVCAPWTLLVNVKYKTFLMTYVFESWEMPGLHALLQLGYLTVSILILVGISKTNEIAMYCLMGSAITFVGVPNLCWIWSSSKIEIEMIEQGDYRTSGSVTWNNFPPMKTAFIPFKCNIVSKPSLTGLKHSVWTPWQPWLLSFSGFFFRVPTESDTAATFASFLTTVEYPSRHPDLWAWLSFAVSLVLYILRYRGQLYKQMHEKESLGTVVLSPPMGRAVFHLLYNYTQCVYFVDGHGIVPALAYFSRYAENMAAQRAVTQKVFFVFSCNSILDFWVLVHGMENILTTYGIALGAEKLDFMIISSTKCFSNISSENGQFTQARRLIHNRLIPEAKSFCYIDLAKFCTNDGDNQTALISIGSPAVSNLSRWIVKSSVETRRVKVFDVVFADSLYRTGVLTDPYKVRRYSVESSSFFFYSTGYEPQ